MRFGWNAQATPAVPFGETEQTVLQRQAEMLQQQLDAIKMRLDVLAANADAVKR